jgi:hypothetical protein
MAFLLLGRNFFDDEPAFRRIAPNQSTFKKTHPSKKHFRLRFLRLPEAAAVGILH